MKQICSLLLLTTTALPAFASDPATVAYEECRERFIQSEVAELEIASGPVTISGPSWVMHWSDTERQRIHGDRIVIPFESGNTTIEGHTIAAAVHTWDIQSIWNEGKQLFGIKLKGATYLVLAYPPTEQRPSVTCFLLPLRN